MDAEIVSKRVNAAFQSMAGVSLDPALLRKIVHEAMCEALNAPRRNTCYSFPIESESDSNG